MPVAPHRVPLLGHLPALLRDPLALLSDATSRGDIVRLAVGRGSLYLLNCPELVRQVQVTDADRFDRGRIFEKARAFVGQGLATSDGALHLRQRRIIQPAFHRDRITAYAEVMREQVESLVGQWQPGRTLAFHQEITDLALAVLTKSIFRSTVGADVVAEVQHALPIVVDGVLARSLLPDAWEKVPTPGNRRFASARTRLRRVVKDAVVAHRAAGVDHGDLLSALVGARDERGDPAMDDDQVRDEVITILMAGTETTASSMSWLFHELTQRPDLEARLRAEVDAAHANGRPTTAELVGLRFLNQLFTEVTRLHAPVWFLMRRVTAPVRFGEVLVPAGAQVVYSPTALHRDPARFPDPLRFDPDRWLPERARDVPRSACIPFGAGVHKCIGDGFARTEAAIAVSTIVSRWTLRPAPGPSVRPRVRATLRPHALRLIAVPR
ncbi:cytochrome P450 [Pseudonocardia spinosispora]|uniref:cytochrome P450 n=1 Tax=Pseudonocardia spinosispora TaxID=103441 RepID=UPI00146F9744|nr:cytochrome P450 [Pseudonocardia spinosispora]